MKRKGIFSLDGINFWYIAIGIALNFFWAMFITVYTTALFVRQIHISQSAYQLVLIAAAFVGPFVIGWLCQALAADGRGPTYGFYGSLGSIGVFLVVVVPTGALVLMMLVAAVAGGLNGGMFSFRGRFHEKP